MIEITKPDKYMDKLAQENFQGMTEGYKKYTDKEFFVNTAISYEKYINEILKDYDLEANVQNWDPKSIWVDITSTQYNAVLATLKGERNVWDYSFKGIEKGETFDVQDLIARQIAENPSKHKFLPDALISKQPSLCDKIMKECVNVYSEKVEAYAIKEKHGEKPDYDLHDLAEKLVEERKEIKDHFNKIIGKEESKTETK